MYITPGKYSYEETYNAFKEVMTGNEALIESAFTISKLENELRSVNEMESMISEELKFELHLNLIFEKKLTQYNRDLYSGKKNAILEHLSSINELQLTKDIIDKAVNIANTSTVPSQPTKTPQPSSASEPTDLDSFSTDSDTGGLGTGEKKDDGILSYMKELLSSLTEGGSPIGIIHLLLDLIGIIPGIGIGEAADVLNAGLYFFREKYMLGILSLISVIPFGDAVKIFKPLAKYTDEILFGGKEALEVISKIPAGQRGLFSRFFTFLKNVGTQAVQKGVSVLNGILGALEKFTGWIPGLGPKLKSFFSSIISKLEKFSTSFGTKVNKAAIDIASTVSNKSIRDFGKAGEIVSNGGTMSTIKKMENVTTTATGTPVMKEVEYFVVKPGKGKPGNMLEIPVADLQKMNYLKKNFPKGFEYLVNTKFKKQGPLAIEKYYKSASDLAAATEKNLIGKAINIGKKTFKFSKKTGIFIGKQIIKLMNDGQPFTDSEGDINSTYHGDIAIWSEMDKRRKKELEENPGQTYSVPKIDDVLQDKEMYDAILKQQNDIATKFGMPSIIPVAYYVAKNRGEDVPTEVNDFMNSAYSDSERESMEKSIKDKIPANKEEKSTPKFESYQFEFKPEKFKYLTPYSKF